MMNRLLKRAGLTLGAILAALLFFVGGAALRLLMGPIALGPLAGAIEDSLNNSLSGLVVRFDQAVLEWSRDDGEVNLIIDGTNVFDASGRIVAQAPRSDLDFDLAALLSGKIALKRFTLLDVQLTAMRDADGALTLGFGGSRDDVDLFEIILNVLDSQDTGGGTLETFSIRNARLAFRDEETGLFIVSPDANLSVNDTDGVVVATLDAAVELSGVPATLSASATVDANGTPQNGHLDIRGLDFAALAMNSERFAALAAYPLRTDLIADFQLDSDGMPTVVSFAVNGAGSVSPPGMDATYLIDAFSAVGSYARAGDLLTFENVSVSGPQGAATLVGTVGLEWNEGEISRLAMALAASDVRADFPDQFADTLLLDAVQFDGVLERETDSITFERLSLSGSNLGAEFSGRVAFSEEQSPAVSVAGTLSALPVPDLLRNWPLHVAGGARNWIVDNVSEGVVGPFALSADIPAGALSNGPVADDAVSLTFPVEGVTANYMTGLTLLTDLHGEAKLSGNTFELRADSAKIGPLTATDGEVIIADLHIPQPAGDIRAEISGDLSDVLKLIDMEPLGYPSRFNVDPDQVGGEAVVALDLTVPMRRDLDVDDVRIAVTTNVDHLSMPLMRGRALSDARMRVFVDNTHLEAEGTGHLNDVPMLFSWQEVFDPGDAYSTEVTVRGTLDAEDREKLRLVAPEWLTGPIAVSSIFHGRHFNFEGADIRADLTNVSVDIEQIDFVKASGERVSGVGHVAFAEDGSVSISDIRIDGSGYEVAGELELDANGGLDRLSMPVVRYGEHGDFGLELSFADDGIPHWRIEGASVDARRMFSDPEEDEEELPAAEIASKSISEYTEIAPIAIDAKLARVLVRDEMVLRDLDFRFAIAENERLTDFHIDAAGPGEGTIEGRFATTDGVRGISLSSDNAGDFIAAFAGFSSFVGGEIEINASFPADSAAQAAPGEDFAGAINITNFTVIDQPFVARLFSIGSLDGPLRLLQGQGIPFSELDAEFTARNRQVMLREGRASGMAMGISFQGILDRNSDLIDINGSLVPVFGLNNMLGAIPVIGDLLVSKDGEGIIGLTYQARGDVGEPDVLVNPFSVLTPGIFRRIFEFGGPPSIDEIAPPTPSLSGVAPEPSQTQTE